MPTSGQKASSIFNALPFETRHAVIPLITDTQIREMEAAKRILVAAHKRTLREIDEKIQHLKGILDKRLAEQEDERS